MKREWMKPGDSVKLKSGEIVTVKSLEYNEICIQERGGHIPKSEIIEIIEPDRTDHSVDSNKMMSAEDPKIASKSQAWLLDNGCGDLVLTSRGDRIYASDAMTKFSIQEVEANNEKWGEKIQKLLDHSYDLHTLDGQGRYLKNELENLLK
jgi:hypothetical protein